MLNEDRLVDALSRWEAVIGLEIHTELTELESKMFCGCPVAFGGEPNTRVCPVCLGLPGALPVPNEAAIEATVRAGLATGCSIATWSQFHRKHYFYPDMPKNYQISQYDTPLCSGGHIDVRIDASKSQPQRPDRSSAYVTRVGVTRIHLEEDTGKMVHVGGADGRIAGASHALVDYNRAGTGLIELVTDPDIRSPEEARRFAQALRLIWRALGISDCNMEEGSMRVDANVSVRRRGESELGVKSEIKNVNSFKSLHDALAYEIVRQAVELERGGRVEQETRHWDPEAARTVALRTKEEAHDYRYFPEPDIPPLELSGEWADRVRASLPELPGARSDRYREVYALPAHDAFALAANLEMAAFFDEAMSAVSPQYARHVSNLMLNELSMHLNAAGIALSACRVTPAALTGLVMLVADGSISTRQAKEVFSEMAETGEPPRAIVERRGLRQLSDVGRIEEVVRRVLDANRAQVDQYRGGKTGVFGYLVGQVMRETRGEASPQVVRDVLSRELEGGER